MLCCSIEYKLKCLLQVLAKSGKIVGTSLEKFRNLFFEFVDHSLIYFFRAWRHNSDCCSACSNRGPGLGTQHPLGNLQLSTTTVLGHLMLPSDLCMHQAHMWYRYTCTQNTNTHKLKVINISNLLFCT